MQSGDDSLAAGTPEDAGSVADAAAAHAAIHNADQRDGSHDDSCPGSSTTELGATSGFEVTSDSSALATQEPVHDSASTLLADREAVVAETIRRLQRPTNAWTQGPRSWVLPGAMTLLAAALRWPNLGRPATLVFDETYYVKDAYSMLVHGVEWAWRDKVDALVIAAHGNTDKLNNLFSDHSSYVVHPPAGKWVIALGEQLFGMTPFGWRSMTALLGTLLVLVVSRIALRITNSPAVAALTGFFLALDGMAIVLSRTAILDGILIFWIACAAACIALDRDWLRARLAADLQHSADAHALLDSWRSNVRTPGPRVRPWLLLAGLCFGLAVSTKWSALWHLAFFGIVTWLTAASTRRLLGIRRPITLTLRRDFFSYALAFLVIPFVVYVASWAGWWLTPNGYNRDWAATTAATGIAALVPAAVRAWVHHHEMIWSFHVHLTSGHAYKANAWSWPVQGRPTSFWYSSNSKCGSEKCATEVIALGNPIIWWAGLIALFHQAWTWFTTRDWRSGLIVMGWLAGWLPWLLFQQRTIFTFYSVVMVPFTCMALARSCARILDSSGNRTARIMLVTAITCGAVALTWFFLPLWTGQAIPYWSWTLRMWFPTWV